MPLSTARPAASARAVSGTIPIPAKTSWGSTACPPAQMDRCNPARFVCLYGLGCRAEVKLNTMLAVQGRAMFRQGRAGHTGQQTRGQFNHMNIKIKPAQRGRGFQTNIAAANHHSCAHSRQASPQKRVHHQRCATHAGSGRISSLRQRPGISPCGQHKMVIRHRAVIGQMNLPLLLG